MAATLKRDLSVAKQANLELKQRLTSTAKFSAASSDPAALAFLGSSAGAVLCASTDLEGDDVRVLKCYEGQSTCFSSIEANMGVAFWATLRSRTDVGFLQAWALQREKLVVDFEYDQLAYLIGVNVARWVIEQIHYKKRKTTNYILITEQIPFGQRGAPDPFGGPGKVDVDFPVLSS